MKKFWEFRARAGAPKIGELMLYGLIANEVWWGDEVTPLQFKADLDALGDIDELNVYINSDGGDVFAAMAICSILSRHPAKKIGCVDGLAASAATVVLCAMDEVVMPRGTMQMVHNPWTFMFGGYDAGELMAHAERLNKIREPIISMYEDHTGLKREEIAAIMDEESWMTAEECVEKGFADRVDTAKKVEARMNGCIMTVAGQEFNLSKYRNYPGAAEYRTGLAQAGGPPERRTFRISEFRVEGAEGDALKIVGYGAVFNQDTIIQTSRGKFKERISPGAFKNAIQVSDTRALFNHNPDYVVGRTKSGTLTLQEDAYGLKYEATPPDTQWARDLMTSMKRGDIDQSSFGFRVAPGGEHWHKEDGMDVRTITEVGYLYDVSPVTYAQYENTEAAVRSYEAHCEEMRRAEHQSAEPGPAPQPPTPQPPTPQDTAAASQEGPAANPAAAPPGEGPQGRNLDLMRRKLEHRKRWPG